ncbi:MAG TPA: hypothetical protein DCZ91_10050 [Lachnospiraceae bacterium]|nr:hypothetical protein [Lachnospiraceae bacterium]
MEANERKYRQPQRRGSNLLENLFIVILAFYPLRHIGQGIDLWDTGYNYANFQYTGTEHMGSMWMFSTYLANIVGNWLTKLPNADTLRGMNLYTGLFVSALALAGYFFCTRKLKMPRGIVFVGEMAAISLCWCPTALLYNYLTYVLFLSSFILLYLGLTKDIKGFLAAAGVLLGANVLVRFSNLPEMAMIVAVWAYDIIVWLEERKDKRPGSTGSAGHRMESTEGRTGNADSAGKSTKTQKDKREFGRDSVEKQGNSLQNKDGRGESGSRNGKTAAVAGGTGFWKKVLGHTLWCFLGYAGALAVLLNYIHIRYGIDAYFEGIARLFAMTDTAVDYKPSAMILGIVERYVEHLYWVARMGIIILGGMALFAVAGWLEERLRKKKDKGNSRASGRFLHIGTRLLWAAVSVAMIVWLYVRKYCSFLFYSYDPVIRPGTMFLMLAMLIAVIRIFHKDSPREEKLLSGMVVLVILVTSIGSNNGVMPSMNNLFVAAPYTLWESWRFLRNAGDIRLKRGLVISSFPAKGILTAFLALCLFQFGGFGAQFVFAEGTGIQDASAFVGNNAVLKNIKMNPEKAQWMMELSDYANENELQGKEVILYGNIPALSYYLQMPAAFSAWPDLDSYHLEVMEEALAELEGMITEKGAEKPVIILEHNYALYKEESDGETSLFPLSEEGRQKIGDEAKWKLLMEFMDRMGYEQTFQNVKFGLYR